MGFQPISIDKYVALHLKNNPLENEKELRKNIQRAIEDYQNGAKCSCGNDIWILGSAFTGNSCFTCITGESNPKDDYEIDSAIKKSEDKKGRRHIDDIDPTQIHGFFGDDGYEINMDLVKKPSLCISCSKNDSEDEEDEILCSMTRHDQRNKEEFVCFGYEKK